LTVTARANHESKTAYYLQAQLLGPLLVTPTVRRRRRGRPRRWL